MSNHLNSKANRHLNPDAQWEDEDGDIIENTTYERQQGMLTVLKKLARKRPTTLDRIFTSIPEPVLNQLTAYAVIHDFKRGRMLVQTE